MPEKKMTAVEWAQKAEWEGGVEDAFDYGLTPDHLAGDVDQEFLAKVIEAHGLWKTAQPAIQQLQNMVETLVEDLDEGEEDDE
jgi:hypothetical protein